MQFSQIQPNSGASVYGRSPTEIQEDRILRIAGLLERAGERRAAAEFLSAALSGKETRSIMERALDSIQDRSERVLLSGYVNVGLDLHFAGREARVHYEHNFL